MIKVEDRPGDTESVHSQSDSACPIGCSKKSMNNGIGMFAMEEAGFHFCSGSGEVFMRVLKVGLSYPEACKKYS